MSALTLEAFREARQRMEEIRSTLKPVPPRQRQIMFCLAAGEEGPLIVPPSVMDVLVSHGVYEECTPAWTPEELDVIWGELEEASCQK